MPETQIPSWEICPLVSRVHAVQNFYGFVFCKVSVLISISGNFPFEELNNTPELLFIRQYNGPGPDMSFMKKMKESSPFLVYLLTGCLKHDTTARLSMQDLQARLNKFDVECNYCKFTVRVEHQTNGVFSNPKDDSWFELLWYATTSLIAKVLVKFQLGVLIDACRISDTGHYKNWSWYTARVEAYRGSEILLNFLTGFVTSLPNLISS